MPMRNRERETIDRREYLALQETSERRIRVLQTLASFTVQINNFRESAPLIEYATQRTRAILHADGVVFYLPGRDKGLYPASQTGEFTTMSDGTLQAMLSRVYNHGEPVLADYPSLNNGKGRYHVAAVPALFRQRAVGVLLAVRSRRGGRFTEEDVSALNILACHSGVAFSKAQEFSEFENQMRKITAAQEIGNALVTSRDLDAILHLVVRRVSEVIEADICSIMLLDKGGENLTIVAAQGLSEEVKRDAVVKVGEGLSGWVAREGRPLLIHDMENDSRFRHILRRPREHYNSSSLLSVPLMVQSNIMGVINVNNKRNGEPFTSRDEQILTVFANHAAIAIENARLYQELNTIATTDAVTGINNHHAFQERLTEEILRAERYKQPLSIILIDVDHFKRVNDTYGHLEGDHVLRELSNLFVNNFRKMDYIARYGGEEFAVILPHSSKEAAMQTANRVRKAVEMASLIQANPVARITVSMGVGTFPEDGHSERELLDRADRALYRAKEEGRNRVLAASDIPAGAANS